MPGRNGTEPTGDGPMTGGRRGFCGDAAPSPGRGGGRGKRNQFYATGLTERQRAALLLAEVGDLASIPPETIAQVEILAPPAGIFFIKPADGKEILPEPGHVASGQGAEPPGKSMDQDILVEVADRIRA